MLIQSQLMLGKHDVSNSNEYISRSTLRLLYEILNIKQTHGIDFQNFFDLMQQVSEDEGLLEPTENTEEDYVHVNVLTIFCNL